MSNVPHSISSSSRESETSMLDRLHFVLIFISALSTMAALFMVCFWSKKYRSLMRTIQDLKFQQSISPQAENSYTQHPHSDVIQTEETVASSVALTVKRENKITPRLFCRTPQLTANLNRSSLSLLQLIKSGHEGVFYKAKMTKGTCKGHSVVICKISKESVTPKELQREVAIMKKLGSHNNILQLLDWDVTQCPFYLIMEFAANGTLRSFLQMNQAKLSANQDLQQLFTSTAYHIAHAMGHMQDRMVVHCDLSLRNILVNSFPHEVKVTEFGLARDLTKMGSRRSRRHHSDLARVPLRWYPPEFFKEKYYGFKSDVWSFGIVLWEMETFGMLPYPNLESNEEVVRHISAGQKNTEPAECREEIAQMMRDCWIEPYTHRPSFKDILRVLENILEADRDYVKVEDIGQDV